MQRNAKKAIWVVQVHSTIFSIHIIAKYNPKPTIPIAISPSYPHTQHCISNISTRESLDILSGIPARFEGGFEVFGGEERGWAAASECHLTLALDLILWQNQLQHNFECQPNGKSGWKDIYVHIYISLVKSGISRGICVPNRRQVYFRIQDFPLNSKGNRKWQSSLLIK